MCTKGNRELDAFRRCTHVESLSCRSSERFCRRNDFQKWNGAFVSGREFDPADSLRQIGEIAGFKAGDVQRRSNTRRTAMADVILRRKGPL